MRLLLAIILTALPCTLAVKKGLLGTSSVRDLVRSQGYPFEEHFVVTEDGYILSLHRIPYGKTNPGKIGRPVLLQHGILCSSAGWVVSRTDKGLGYILADQGYDVWMPNSRGNPYSRLHKSLNINSAEYWDFSFHEMGYYDLPASIDYILGQTGHPNLHYVGHSQGTTIFFVLTSTRPEYNDKIVHMSALAPIAFLDHTRGTIKGLTLLASELQKFAKITGIHEVLSDSWALHVVEKILCKAYSFTEPICDNILFLIAGYDSQQWNMTLLPIITDFFPAGTSIKQLVHFGQSANNGEKFRMFDYGSEKNLQVYKQEVPPDYDLGKITTRVTLHCAHNDWLSGLDDVAKLNNSLVNSKPDMVQFYYFNHLDYLWAIDVVTLLYNNLLSIMAKF